MRSIFILLLALLAASAFAQDFAPISQEELRLKDNPLRPGEPAMILAREMHTDDTKPSETHYTRLKIFNEQGRSYADVTIPYWKDAFRITDLKARTIQQDGRVVEFRGQVFDQVIVKSRRVRLSAKKFTLPEVQPGSIMEYRYTLRWSPWRLYSTEWNIQGELFVRRATYTIKPNTATTYGFHGIAYLPRGTQAVQQEGMYRLEVENVAPLEEEPFMPPPEHYSGRMIFYYARAGLEDPEAFWMRHAKEWTENIEPFIGSSKLRSEIARLQGAATPLDRLERLYARVQGLRNLSFAEPPTEQERKKMPENRTPEHVLRNGFGYESDLAFTLVALARAAGFDAWPALVSSRNRYVFNKQFQDENQLDAWVVVVKVDGKPLFLDPGTPHCPFGLLSWEKTAVVGLRLQQRGSVWVETPAGAAAEATLARTGTFAVDADGDLSGTLDVVFSGQEALSRYLAIDERDDQGSAEYLENEAKSWFPGSATVKLTSPAPRPSASQPLRASFSVEVPGYATVTGARILLDSTVMAPALTLPVARTRKYPMHLPHAFEHTDDLAISLPPDYTIEEIPVDRTHAPTWALYQLSRSDNGRVMRVKRTYRIDQPILSLQQYPVLRGFLTGVTLGNEEHVVLVRSGEAAAKKE